MTVVLELVPIRLKDAQRFIHEHHRHNIEPRGWLFGVGLKHEGELVGVGIAGRPSARALDDGRTVEITRTCTTGIRNANSRLYGALWRAAQALGYRKAVTYTQLGESGASLRAVGWSCSALLPARNNWADSSIKLHDLRNKPQAELFTDPRRATGLIERCRWEIIASDG